MIRMAQQALTDSAALPVLLKYVEGHSTEAASFMTTLASVYKHERTQSQEKKKVITEKDKAITD